jgi:RNA polymerase sigma factor (sigma-70 family)
MVLGASNTPGGMPSADFAPTDQVLWGALKRGDEGALAQLYQRYGRVLLQYGYRVTPDADLIQDGIQDLFIDLWRGRAGLAEAESVKFYLFRALRNRLQRNRRQQHLDAWVELDDTLPNPTEDPEQNWMEAEAVVARQQHMQACLRRLSKRQREAINLRYFHDFSNEEVAELMGLHYQSVANLLYSAIKTLRQHLRLAFSFVMLLWG